MLFSQHAEKGSFGDTAIPPKKGLRLTKRGTASKRAKKFLVQFNPDDRIIKAPHVSVTLAPQEWLQWHSGRTFRRSVSVTRFLTGNKHVHLFG